MEWRVGMIPRPRWSIQKGSPQAFRTALNAHMLREQNATERDQLPPSQPEKTSDLEAPNAKLPQPASRQGAEPSPEQARLRLSLLQKLTVFLDDWRCCPSRV